MVTKFSHKVSLIAEDIKVLIIGTLEDELNNTIDIYFKHKEYVELNKDTVDILNENLYEQYDIVIFSFNHESLKVFQNAMKSFPKNTIVLIESSFFSDFSSSINSIFSLLVLPVEEESFLEKIYNVLSTLEIDKLVKSKEKVISKHKNDQINNNIGDFLDKYHGNIMFLNDDLNENYNRLKDLEISIELFNDISSNILKLNNILKTNEKFAKLSVTFERLSSFLSSLDLESIDPKNYNAFDYLTTIIEDITIYLDELFVYKLFKDVHVVEDSLENNIKYFEDSLYNNVEQDNDNLEFF